MFLRAVEAKLRQASPGAPSDARFGGVTFVQRFGAALNAHLHYHCCLIDGVFSAEGDDLRFHPAAALAEAAADMRQWEHGSGFSLDATIRIEAHDRGGLEQLLRYCARPAFARERLEWADDEQHLLRWTSSTVGPPGFLPLAPTGTATRGG